MPHSTMNLESPSSFLMLAFAVTIRERPELLFHFPSFCFSSNGFIHFLLFLCFPSRTAFYKCENTRPVNENIWWIEVMKERVTWRFGCKIKKTRSRLRLPMGHFFSTFLKLPIRILLQLSRHIPPQLESFVNFDWWNWQSLSQLPFFLLFLNHTTDRKLIL